MSTEISVPDIGDFESFEIIEILVKPGDIINKNDPIVTLESDKSSVEVPSPFAGKMLRMMFNLFKNDEEKMTFILSKDNDGNNIGHCAGEQDPLWTLCRPWSSMSENQIPVRAHRYRYSTSAFNLNHFNLLSFLYLDYFFH